MREHLQCDTSICKDQRATTRRKYKCATRICTVNVMAVVVSSSDRHLFCTMVSAMMSCLVPDTRPYFRRSCAAVCCWPTSGCLRLASVDFLNSFARSCRVDRSSIFLHDGVRNDVLSYARCPVSCFRPAQMCAAAHPLLLCP